jgi:hypothetical protein
MSEPRHRYFGAYQGDAVMQGGAVEYDMAGLVDAPHEELAERLGISPAAAERVLAWHAEALEETITAEVGVCLARVVSLLLLPQKNLIATIWGLAFSIGIITAADGVQSMSERADRMRMHRASLSYWKRRWDALLGRYGHLNGKSPETCERLRAARMRVLGRKPPLS